MASDPECLQHVHAALELIESISTAIDNKKHCAGVFIDLKKAFDTVNHDLLIKKLFVYGIRGTANAWLNNYLTNINQYVIADGHSSCMRLINHAWSTTRISTGSSFVSSLHQ